MIGPVEMGALLKKIRLSKNLTLKELASDYYQYLSYQNLNVENLISHYLDFFFC